MVDDGGDDIEVNLRMTRRQARAVDRALDAFAALCIGKLDEVACLVRDGTIAARAPDGSPRTPAPHDAADRIAELMDAAKAVLGHHPSSSHGIGHAHVHPDGHRAYEVHKVLSRALALHADPAPAFRGVNYDGLIVRYTRDPAPSATVGPAVHHDGTPPAPGR